MHVRKSQFISLLFLLSMWGSGVAQNVDSVEISGKVRWRDTGIMGYPTELKVISKTKQVYLSPIDSTGKYHFRLPVGSYTLTPSKHFHWMGEEYIRINDSVSKISIDLPSGKKFIAPVLELDTIALANILPAVGVAHDFTKKQATLVDDFIKKHMTFFDIPGASLAIIKKGKVIYSQVYGVSNVQSGMPVTEKTLFEAGSVTKSVFAFVVMRLVERNILKLDQPLYELLPFGAVSHDERYRIITARHVLCHQSGLPNWAQRDRTGHFNLLFTPGTKFGYSGEGYEYLKRVIEHITGKNISQILNEELLIPLNLTGFYFKGNEYIKKYAAHGHIDLKPSNIRFIEKPMMAFSLFTEAKSFSNFMLALRNKKGLKSATYDEMLSIQSTRNDGVDWGLGFELEKTPLGLSYGHSGSTSSGFICNFTFFPQLDVGYVFLTNSNMGDVLSIPLLTQFLITGKTATK